MIRNVAFVAAVILVVVLFVGVLYLVRAPTPTSTALASPNATATVTPVASTATPAPSPTPSTTPTGMYVTLTWKFSVVLPPPYRRSARLSLENTGGRPAAQNVFTARTDADEAALAAQNCQTECEVFNYTAIVQITTGTGSQTPRQYYTANRGATGEQIDDVTVDGHQAIKVTNGATYPLQYVVKDGDRIFTVAYQIFPLRAVPPGASKEKLDAILASFKFLP
jgi:hypothetical protein